jgi:hypothetical protein
VIHGFKGFDKDMKCRGFQFEEGKEYETDEAKACESGFHACEYPLDVFGYYAPTDSIFHTVEQSGKIDRHGGDSKVASTKIKIGSTVDIIGMVKASVKFILNRVDLANAPATNTGYQSAATNTGHQSAATNTGYQSAATNTGHRSAATNTGHRSAATNTGDRSAATNTGDWSAATVEGRESIACGFGLQNKAKGSLGCWIVLSEWKAIKGELHIIAVKSAKIDGKTIKADTFYELVNSTFTECE